MRRNRRSRPWLRVGVAVVGVALGVRVVREGLRRFAGTDVHTVPRSTQSLS